MYAETRKSLDLTIVTALVVIAVGLALAGIDFLPLRFLFGLPLVLILPGYALVAAFAGPTLGAAERLVLIIGLSLATTALGGILLNMTPWGLQAGSWAILLGTVTLVGGAVALWRRRTSPDQARPFNFNPGFNPRQLALLGAAMVVVVIALGVARFGVEDQSPTLTQFWMIPGETNPSSLRLGVISTEAPTSKFRLQLESEGKVIQEVATIELTPGERWEKTVELSAEQSPKGKLEAKLYKLDSQGVATLYRWASLPAK